MINIVFVNWMIRSKHRGLPWPQPLFRLKEGTSGHALTAAMVLGDSACSAPGTASTSRPCGYQASSAFGVLGPWVSGGHESSLR